MRIIRIYPGDVIDIKKEPVVYCGQDVYMSREYTNKFKVKESSYVKEYTRIIDEKTDSMNKVNLDVAFYEKRHYFENASSSNYGEYSEDY